MTHVAVILSGCGYLDGAEIREAVLALLYLDEAGATVSVFAPDSEQMHVVNHLTKEATTETRNVLVEAARIARSDVSDLATLNPDAFDALVIPGGYGVAKNLSDLALKGASATVHPEFLRVAQGFHAAQKPIGAICIAPAVLALALKGSGSTLTIGEDAATAAVITEVGCTHQNAGSAEAVLDTVNNVASCSAYMREDGIANIAKGIKAVITHVIDLAKSKK